MLWPYRRSAIKNQQRWTFGGVYPRAYSEARGEDDPWIMQTQCLVSGDEGSAIEVKVRFLHIVERRVGRKDTEGTLEFVDELRVGGDISVGSEEEPLVDPTGEVVGTLVRSWRTLCGAVEVGAEPLRERTFRVTVRITNTTAWEGEDRESTLEQTFVSTHTALEVEGGEFVSLTDPPQELRELAQGCENIKTWPVLVGEEGSG